MAFTLGTCAREGCDRALSAQGPGRTPRFCSSTCRVAAHRARVRAARPAPLPRVLLEHDRWLRYANTRRGARMTRRPITVSGRSGSSTDPRTWSSFSAADASSLGHGLGFALGAGIGCIDLDHCIVDGVLAPWAQEIVDRCPPTYIEISPSGEGLHIFGWLPPGPGRGQRGGVGIEFYSTGRFMTVTRNPWPGAVPELADLSRVVATL